MPHGRFRLVFTLLLMASLLASLVPAPLHAQTPEWLEPRGLSVLDFVGQVPEEHLRGSILVFDEAGVVQYLSGRRNGDQVTIEVSMTPYRSPQFTEIWCLGRRPLFDEWPVAVPPSQMRVFSAGADVTNQVGSMWYFPAAQERPVRGSLPTSGPVERYADNRSTPVTRTADGAINVPANMGCKFFAQNTLVGPDSRVRLRLPATGGDGAVAEARPSPSAPTWVRASPAVYRLCQASSVTFRRPP